MESYSMLRLLDCKFYTHYWGITRQNVNQCPHQPRYSCGQGYQRNRFYPQGRIIACLNHKYYMSLVNSSTVLEVPLICKKSGRKFCLVQEKTLPEPETFHDSNQPSIRITSKSSIETLRYHWRGVMILSHICPKCGWDIVAILNDTRLSILPTTLDDFVSG